MKFSFTFLPFKFFWFKLPPSVWFSEHNFVFELLSLNHTDIKWSLHGYSHHDRKVARSLTRRNTGSTMPFLPNPIFRKNSYHLTKSCDSWKNFCCIYILVYSKIKDFIYERTVNLTTVTKCKDKLK